MVDSYGNKYPYNPAKEKILEAEGLIQEYRRAMSIGVACDRYFDQALSELNARRGAAEQKLIRFFLDNVVDPIAKELKGGKYREINQEINTLVKGR